MIRLPRILNLEAHLTFTMLLVMCLFLSLVGTAWPEEPLVIRQTDLSSEIGTSQTYVSFAADANSQNETISTVIESMHLGDITLIKAVTSSRGNQQPDMWCVISVDGVRYFQEGATETPPILLPLPLKVGSTSVFEMGGESERLHVEREETISVPAGTFKCLVCVWKKDGLIVRTWWLSPGVGFIQTKGANGFTSVLKALHKPGTATPNTDSVVLAHFNTGSPASDACPKARFGNHINSGPEGISLSTVDRTQGAADTAMSLLWSYHTNTKTWVQANIMLAGSWNEFFDLTPYDSISFYIKGFRRGQCAFMVQGKPVQKSDESWINTPITYTTDWKKITVKLNRRAFSKLDLQKTILIGLGHQGRDNDDNIIWIDEITCHRNPIQTKRNKQ